MLEDPFSPESFRLNACSDLVSCRHIIRQMVITNNSVNCCVPSMSMAGDEDVKKLLSA